MLVAVPVPVVAAVVAPEPVVLDRVVSVALVWRVLRESVMLRPPVPEVSRAPVATVA